MSSLSGIRMTGTICILMCLIVYALASLTTSDNLIPFGILKSGNRLYGEAWNAWYKSTQQNESKRRESVEKLWRTRRPWEFIEKEHPYYDRQGWQYNLMHHPEVVSCFLLINTILVLQSWHRPTLMFFSWPNAKI